MAKNQAGKLSDKIRAERDGVAAAIEEAEADRASLVDQIERAKETYASASSSAKLEKIREGAHATAAQLRQLREALEEKDLLLIAMQPRLEALNVKLEHAEQDEAEVAFAEVRRRVMARIEAARSLFDQAEQEMMAIMDEEAFAAGMEFKRFGMSFSVEQVAGERRGEIPYGVWGDYVRALSNRVVERRRREEREEQARELEAASAS